MKDTCYCTKYTHFHIKHYHKRYLRTFTSVNFSRASTFSDSLPNMDLKNAISWSFVLSENCRSLILSSVLWRNSLRLSNLHPFKCSSNSSWVPVKSQLKGDHKGCQRVSKDYIVHQTLIYLSFPGLFSYISLVCGHTNCYIERFKAAAASITSFRDTFS